MADSSLGALTPINVVKLAMWRQLTNEPTYSERVDFDKRFMTYTDSIAANTAKLSGCGVVVDSVTKVSSGSITYGIHAFRPYERKEIFGETWEKNNNNKVDPVVTTGNEVIPYVVCAHAEELSNGHWNLYKYFKVKFEPNESSVQQISDGSVTFSTTTIKGEYIRQLDGGVDKMRAVLYDVDPVTQAGVIRTWFSEPLAIPSRDSYSEEDDGGSATTLKNLCCMKIDGTKIGDTASEGTWTFAGIATGGTEPYDFSFYYRAKGSNAWTTAQEESSSVERDITISITQDTTYEFKYVVKDADGVTIAKTEELLVQNEP